MVVAITGAGGDIGARLLLGAQDAGFAARGLLRHATPRLARYKDLDLRRTGLSDEAEVTAALAGVDAVVHTALEHAHGSTQSAIAANTSFLATLVAACRKQQIRRLIHLSSIVALPPRITANAVAEGVYSSEDDWYSQVKVASEKWLAVHARDLEVTIVRAGLVYGPYMNWTRHAAGVVAGPGIVLPENIDAPCYAVHVDDLCELLGAILQHPKPPALVYGINPQPVTWDTFFTCHARGLGKADFSLHRLPLVVIESALQSPPRSQISRPDRGAVSEFASWLWHCPSFAPVRRWRAARRPAPPRSAIALAPVSALPTQIWPTRFELETYRSTMHFTPAHTGEEAGFTYRRPFEIGMRNALAWVRGSFTDTTTAQ